VRGRAGWANTLLAPFLSAAVGNAYICSDAVQPATKVYDRRGATRLLADGRHTFPVRNAFPHVAFYDTFPAHGTAVASRCRETSSPAFLLASPLTRELLQARRSAGELSQE